MRTLVLVGGHMMLEFLGMVQRKEHTHKQRNTHQEENGTQQKEHSLKGKLILKRYTHEKELSY